MCKKQRELLTLYCNHKFCEECYTLIKLFILSCPTCIGLRIDKKKLMIHNCLICKHECNPITCLAGQVYCQDCQDKINRLITINKNKKIFF